MRYRVLVDGLCYPTDPRILRRLAAGEKIPLGERRMCEPHSLGDVVEDLPRVSIPGLLRKGWIEEAADGQDGIG